MHIVRTLMPLARTAPGPASPFTGSGASRPARSWFYARRYAGQPLTTIANSKMRSRYRKGMILSTGRSEPPALKDGARRAVLVGELSERPPVFDDARSSTSDRSRTGRAARDGTAELAELLDRQRS